MPLRWMTFAVLAPLLAATSSAPRASAAAAGARAFAITALPVPPGAEASNAWCISDAGHVGGVVTIGGLLRGAVWLDGQVTVLGVPAGVPVEAEISVQGINGRGEAAVQAWMFGFQHQSSHRWQSGAFTPVATLGGVFSLAWNIDEAGAIVGSSTTDPAADGPFDIGPNAAYVADAGGTRLVGSLPLAIDGTARAINERGQIVGSARPGQHRAPHAFIHDPDEGMSDLGALGGQFAQSEAYDVDSAGRVVGRSQAGDLYVPLGGASPQLLWHPVRWERGRIVELPTLPGYIEGLAFGVNDAGLVVGLSRTTAAGDTSALRATLWIDDVAHDLGALIPPDTEWDQLGSASAVAADGRIVGWGRVDGAIRAFLLTPLE